MRGKHQKNIFTIIAAIFSALLLASCVTVKVAAIPEKGGEILTGNISSDKVITISNKSGDISCSGNYKLVKNSVSCENKKWEATLTCSDERTVDLTCTSVSCSEAHGTAKDSTGIKYTIYIGLEESVNEKIADSKK
jgi:hypothetical protein